MIRLEGRRLQYAATISASLLNANSGMAILWPSPVLPMLYAEDSPIGSISWNEGSWVTSLLLIGSVFGNIMLGVQVNYFGRRGALLIASVPIFISWMLILFARSVIILYIARFVLGFFNAVPVAITIMYVGETSEACVRGRLSFICLTFFETAGVMTVIVGAYFTYETLALIAAVFPVLFFMTFYFMPETPYFYLRNGDVRAAYKSLKQFRGKEDVSEELSMINANVEEAMSYKSSVLDLFRENSYRKPLFIILGLKVLHQLSGGIAIQSYMKSIFQLAGTSLDPDTASIICAIVPLPAMILASYLIDRVGRKPLYYVSLMGCIIAMLFETIFFFLKELPDTNLDLISWLPISGIFLNFAFRPVGISSLANIILNELFPANIKGEAISVSLVFGSTLSSMVSYGFPGFSMMFGVQWSFLIFCIICFVGLWFVIIYVPETKGQTLEAIQSEIKEETQHF
ncbi:Trehalose transporter 1-2 [Carabus blaptoides fortunei]